MIIKGDDLRDGSEFRFTTKPSSQAAAVFIAITSDGVITTRRYSDIAGMPGDTIVIANWHGERRTDAFRTPYLN